MFLTGPTFTTCQNRVNARRTSPALLTSSAPLADNACMDFFEIVKQRRSIRLFADRPVAEEQIERVLETALAAPSAGNLQAYRIFVVKSNEVRAALTAAALGQDCVRTAPVVLVFCTHAAQAAKKYGERGERLYTLQDATIACTFAMLAIEALGLATVWVGAFREEAAWKAIGSPEGLVPVAMLPFGYAGEQPEPTFRRSVDKLVHRL
jgi:nitroreductase